MGVGGEVWGVVCSNSVSGMFRGAVVRGKGRGWRDDGTAHVPPPHEGTLPMGNNPCRLAADMV